MFSAVQRGKAGHWFEHAATLGWRRAIRIEDTLTAIVFDALLGLPGPRVAELLAHALSPAIDPASLAWLHDDDFQIGLWRRVGDNVEPDALLYSEARRQLLVFEAKLGGWQKEDQIRSQIAAIRKEPEFDGYELRIVALGGDNAITVVKLLTDLGVPAHDCTWLRLASAVRAGVGAASAGFERRQLGQLLDALSWFGHRPIAPLALDLPVPSPRAFERLPRFTEDFGRRRSRCKRQLDDIAPLLRPFPPSIAQPLGTWRFR